MSTNARILPRADHVGSLLRPDSLEAARTGHLEDGTVSAEALRDVENAAIREAVAMQEAARLPLVTGGEYRRAFWHYDFMDGLTGLDVVRRERDGVRSHGAALPPLFPAISGRIDFPDDQRRKLERVVETAEAIWGGVA